MFHFLCVAKFSQLGRNRTWYCCFSI